MWDLSRFRHRIITSVLRGGLSKVFKTSSAGWTNNVGRRAYRDARDLSIPWRNSRNCRHVKGKVIVPPWREISTARAHSATAQRRKIDFEVSKSVFPEGRSVWTFELATARNSSGEEMKIIEIGRTRTE